MFNKLKQQFAPKKKKNALDEFVDKVKKKGNFFQIRRKFCLGL